MMKHETGTVVLAAALASWLPAASAAARPPPPTNVKVTHVEGVDRALGTFIMEWMPAMDASGAPYRKYLLSAGCKYEGIDAGTQATPTGVSGLWQVIATETSFRVKVTCSCVTRPYRSNAIATAGSDAYTPNSGWVNTEKFLIPCGGK